MKNNKFTKNMEGLIFNSSEHSVQGKLSVSGRFASLLTLPTFKINNNRKVW